MTRAAGSVRSSPGPRGARGPGSAGNVLDVVPVVNDAVRIERRESGLLLWVPLQPRWWMGPPLNWILPFRHEKGILLDDLGRQVLDACDGVATVEAIVEGFAARHRLRFHEARQSVLAFLKMLGQRYIVAFVQQPGASGATSESGTKPAAMRGRES
jgi:hypothetical protein